MNKFLVTLHRWVGFPVGLLFAITFATGFIISIDELSLRLNANLSKTNSSDSFQFRPTTFIEDGKALEKITEGKRNLRRITLPTDKTPYYLLSTREEQWLYSLNEPYLEVHLVKEDDGFFHTVLQLHRNFLLGKEGFLAIEGKHYAAWVGLIAVFLSVLGFWIWWPKRRLFSLKNTLPRGKKRKDLYGNHTAGGVISLVAIIVLGLSGASITYKDITKDILNVGDSSTKSKKIKRKDSSESITKQQKNQLSMRDSQINSEQSWSHWLEMASRQMPKGSTLTQINYPRKKRSNKNSPQEKELIKRNKGASTEALLKHKKISEKLITFKFVTPNSWLWLAQSSVVIDTNTSKVKKVVLFNKLPFGEKIYAILKPLHTGHGLPIFYVILQCIFGLIGSVMVLTGVIMFVTKKRKWKKVKNVNLFIKSKKQLI